MKNIAGCSYRNNMHDGMCFPEYFRSSASGLSIITFVTEVLEVPNEEALILLKNHMDKAKFQLPGLVGYMKPPVNYTKKFQWPEMDCKI